MVTRSINAAISSGQFLTLQEAAFCSGSYILHLECRFKDLDFGALAMSFGLLRLPKMSELKNGRIDVSSFKPSTVNPDTVRFK